MKNLKKHTVFFLLPLSLLFTTSNLSSQEIPDRGPIPFAAYDQDSNGMVSAKEFKSAQDQRLAKRKSQGVPMRNPAFEPSFVMFDSNKDGQLSKDELVAGQKKQMKMRRLQAGGMGQGKVNPQAQGNTNNGTTMPEYDPRKLISMPDNVRTIMRKDMQANMSILSSIIGYLAANDLEAAAKAAELGMGKSAMGKHRGSGAAPGWFMSSEMRTLGWGLHEAASEFAITAKQGDMNKTLKALEKVTSTCVACHFTYRTR